MELLLRVRGSHDRVADVVAVVDAAHTVSELTTALCEHLDERGDGRGGERGEEAVLGSVRLGRSLRPGAVIAESGLISGDELTLGPTVMMRRSTPPPNPAVSVDLIGGPDSGRSRLLRPGRYSIGRGPDADIVIDDPSVSRHHAVVGIDEAWQVELRPAAHTANGVNVNGVEAEGPTPVTADDIVGLGATRLAFRAFEHDGHQHQARLGQVDFHRTPYRPPPVIERQCDPFGPIPARSAPRKLQVIAALAPLAAGITMFAVTRQVHFLALTLISPVVMVANAIDERRSGRRKFGGQLAAFRAGLVTHRNHLESLRRAERVDRLRAAPDLADLVRRAELHTVDLWARGRTAPDFLRLRLGSGPARVRFAMDLQPGGAVDLRDEALTAFAGLDEHADVPVTVDLCADTVLGIHGDRQVVDGIATSLAIQAATLHSPEDLTIVAAVSPGRSFDWFTWLPHLRSVSSPLPGDHLATDVRDTDLLIARLLEVALARSDDAVRHGRDPAWPRILAFVDADLTPATAMVARLLDVAAPAGISVIWMASSAAQVTRSATRVLAARRLPDVTMVGRLWSTDPAIPDRDLTVEHLRSQMAAQAARALAPLRDASTASLATSIPRTAPLLDVLGVGRPSAAWVTRNWEQATAYGLRFPVGLAADGRLDLDLVHDGPHTLIGGTSGSGKSELLQSIVAGLAAYHPPSRVNFLFIDYKGGAASQVFERLPHTVGHVTNLGGALALRALTSLRAELNRRMALLEGRAKDLADMLDVAPADAPPSLVIIIDEFATLVTEVPGFVEGVVDIAQRGRSLGIHLVLATQRPSGSVNDNILANTNLRISLRMLDRAESIAILASPHAASIPVPLRGRGFIRFGPRRLVEFQGAFAGASLVSDDCRKRIAIAPFARPDASPPAVTSPVPPEGSGAESQLVALIDAISEADRMSGRPPPRRPWRDVLPDVVTLAEIGNDPFSGQAQAVAGRHLAIGLADVPERQDQLPGIVDLEEGGGLLVFGSGGSGKTTLLRTIAASLDGCSGSDRVATMVFDFASRGLVGLRCLPSVIEVVTADDLEAVTRHLTVLDNELERRRRLLADAGAEHLTAYNSGRSPLARIVVLVDGFDGLVSALTESRGGLGSGLDRWAELVNRVVIDGRQVGIHSVVTAQRRSAIPARLYSAVANRLVLRHADEGSYADHGIPVDRVRGLDLVAGRGLLNGDTVVQVASVSCDPLARSQRDAIERMGSARGKPTSNVLRSSPLPDRLRLGAVPGSEGFGCSGPRATIGVADVSGSRVVVDLEWSNLVIAGPPRSGRSTALSAVALGLPPHLEMLVIGPSNSPLTGLDVQWSAFGRAADVAPALDRLAERLRHVASGERLVLLIDDADHFDDPEFGSFFERLAVHEALRVAGAVEMRAMAGYTSNSMVALLRRSRRQLVLQPDDQGEFLQATGVKVAARPGLRFPPGRGVLLVDRVPAVVHVAIASDDRVDRVPGMEATGTQPRACASSNTSGSRRG